MRVPFLNVCLSQTYGIQEWDVLSLKDNIDKSKLKTLQKERDQYTLDRLEMMANAAMRSKKDDLDFEDII